MKRLMALMSSAFIVLALFACGGGGGGGDDDAVVVPQPALSSSPEGLYTGRTSTGRLATGIILDDNTFYILYSTIGVDDEIAGLVQGNLTSTNSTYTSTNAKDFNLEGLGVLPATVEGPYVEKQSSSGSVYYPTLLETITYNTVYDAAYELTPSIATIAGSYSGEVVTSEGWEAAAFTISSTGILSGSGSSGCSVSGAVVPRTNGNVYNMTITFGGPPCLFANQSLIGVSYYNTPESWLTGVVINATRTDGVLFTGGKVSPDAGTSGGSPSAPASVDLNDKNLIGSNDSSNYFKIDLLSGQTVFFDSIPNGNIDPEWLRLWQRTCSAQGGIGSPISLTLNGVRKDNQMCSLTSYAKADVDGEYHIAASLNGTSGYFYISVLDNDYIVGSQIGIGGEPNNVGNLNFSGSNLISVSSLKNYYSYSGIAEDKIIIYSSMLESISDEDQRRCSASSGAWSSSTAYGICWDRDSDGDLDCSCSTDATITLSADGPIIINMKYLYKNSGTFTADQI